MSVGRLIGRPPRRREVPLVEAFGEEWFRLTQLNAVELGHRLGVALPSQPDT